MRKCTWSVLLAIVALASQTSCNNAESIRTKSRIHKQNEELRLVAELKAKHSPITDFSLTSKEGRMPFLFELQDDVSSGRVGNIILVGVVGDVTRSGSEYEIRLADLNCTDDIFYVLQADQEAVEAMIKHGVGRGDTIIVALKPVSLKRKAFSIESTSGDGYSEPYVSDLGFFTLNGICLEVKIPLK